MAEDNFLSCRRDCAVQAIPTILGNIHLQLFSPSNSAKSVSPTKSNISNNSLKKIRSLPKNQLHLKPSVNPRHLHRPQLRHLNSKFPPLINLLDFLTKDNQNLNHPHRFRPQLLFLLNLIMQKLDQDK